MSSTSHQLWSTKLALPTPQCAGRGPVRSAHSKPRTPPAVGLQVRCPVRLGAHRLGQKSSAVNVRTSLTGAASCEGAQRHCADSFAIDHQRGVGSIGARSLNHPGRIALNKTQGAGWQGPAVSTTYHTGIWARARTSGWMAKVPCPNGDCRLIPPERDTQPQTAPLAAVGFGRSARLSLRWFRCVCVGLPRKFWKSP